MALGEDGKPSFYEVMRRDGLRRMEKVPQMQRSVPITYMIFDILYLNGDWVTSLPLKERQELLRRNITPNAHIQFVENFSSLEGLYQVVEAQGMEGIMIKDVTSTYQIDGKDQRWRKKKFYRDLVAVVGGVTLRNNIVNALMLGLFDEAGRFWYIGHAGTGKLSQADWRNLTEQIQPLVTAQMPFANRPPRTAESLWLLPELTVKIAFAEWREGHSLRQPSIQGFVDVPPKLCTLEQNATNR
ncbi:DNA ligase [Brevibacillus choshinensis]|uniref:ATP-dependent DNA ligase n=1 Tax=Brevibacillus choshinensis TaxID=54911 RepID=UPI0023B03E55|nr:DNA ligase [Brevibacillus choshinensis]